MQSIRKKSFAAEQLARQKKTNPWPWIAAGIAVAVVVIGIGYALLSRYQVEEKVKPFIAVLPFDNISGDENDEYFSDGVTIDIITYLQHISEITVMSWGSVKEYKDTGKSRSDIEEELKRYGVTHIVEGTVNRQGNQVRIIPNLVEITTGKVSWNFTYNRQGKGTLSIQSDIASEIADNLKIVLSSTERALVEKVPTDNQEAYNFYLQGHSHWYKRDYEGFMTSLDFYRKALELDSNYALAYTGIADTYSMLGEYTHITPNEAFPEAKKAVEKALEIDGTLAEAYTSRAMIYLEYDWDWPRAELDFKRAITLNPGNILARYWYNSYLRVMGRYDEALAELEIASKINPLSPITYGFLSLTYNRMGRYEDAMEQCQKGLKIDSNNWQFHEQIGEIYLLKGNFEEAIKAFQHAKELTKGVKWIDGVIGMAYGLSGEREKAEQKLNELFELA